MPTEAELRALLRGEDDGSPRLDADRIIRRARARRRPKQLAVGALSGLAVVAVVVPVTLGLGAMRPMSASDEAGSAAAPESGDSLVRQEDTAGIPGDGLTVACMPPLWEGDAAPTGVELQTMQEVAGGDVMLTMSNDGTEAMAGTLAADPTLLLVADGVVIGWSATGGDATRVDLPRGRQLVLTVSLDAVDCTGAPLAAGVYDTEAVLPIRHDDGTITVVTAALTPITVPPAE
ncbi:MAG: hypothetical protein QM598_10295 [Protaetiibacter sp.]